MDENQMDEKLFQNFEQETEENAKDPPKQLQTCIRSGLLFNLTLVNHENLPIPLWPNGLCRRRSYLKDSKRLSGLGRTTGSIKFQLSMVTEEQQLIRAKASGAVSSVSGLCDLRCGKRTSKSKHVSIRFSFKY